VWRPKLSRFEKFKEVKMMRYFIAGLSALLVTASWAYGHSEYVARIPNGLAFSCATCHTEMKFQQDFKNNGLKWDRALAVKDSDGDRASNGVELQDPEGKWSQGKADPKVPGWKTYNPDDHTSVPPYAPVEATSMGRVKALFR
jgi:hypothetical protein